VTKSFRQGQILKLVRMNPVHTQEDLAKLLREQGIEATQVTLSRDVRELHLVKTPNGYRQMDGRGSGREAESQFELLAGEFVQDVKTAQNLVVLKTAPGHASSVAVALDAAGWAEVVGTVAGDDTILAVTPDNTTASKVCHRLLGLLGEL
jgi:transcriptional regulator of arginine metabolism